MTTLLQNKLIRRTDRPTGAGPPAGYALVFNQTFTEALASLLRTNGAMYRGFNDGLGWWEHGTGSQATTYDARGIEGQTNNFIPAYDYAWPGSFQPVSKSGDKLSLDGGTCTSAGIDAVVPYYQASTRFPNYGSFLNTKSSFQWRGDVYIECRIQMPSTVGTWGNLWTWTDSDIVSAPAGTVKQFEIDVFEYVPADASNAALLQSNIHGHATVGGGYDVVDGTKPMGVNLSSAYRTVAVHRKGNKVTWYVDRKAVRTLTIPAAWTAASYWSYLILSLDISNTGIWPGTYAGTTDHMLVDYIKVYVPASGAGQNVFLRPYNQGTTYNSTLGANLVTGDITNAASPGFWLDSGTSSLGTKVGPFTPRRIASAGGAFNRRYFTGRATTSNAQWDSEAGTTATKADIVNGQAYRITYFYEYGTSNSGYVNIGIDGGSTLVQATLATTVVTDLVGNLTSASITTHPLGFKVFQADFTAGSGGDSHISFGPNSATSGQDVIWYYAWVQPIP